MAAHRNCLLALLVSLSVASFVVGDTAPGAHRGRSALRNFSRIVNRVSLRRQRTSNDCARRSQPKDADYSATSKRPLHLRSSFRGNDVQLSIFEASCETKTRMFYDENCGIQFPQFPSYCCTENHAKPPLRELATRMQQPEFGIIGLVQCPFDIFDLLEGLWVSRRLYQ
ncbi:hypothetical protein CAPTEDRAFT_199702 [Capitella teleta]|uniref:Uncharacterized protein n=1 Tax=Capitella teleta TaxID=283909 RepID=R7TBE7_CAPTE|nr:hypothetical protein CAPTEDRAFT_199702 [Capitella teleta]|eukprot:ELT91044.1 hypothetical protein CAPTEDRAFT_199702 [Capitella teleta]